MKYSDWMPIRIFLDLELEFEEVFEALIDEPWGRTFCAEWSPAVDIDETPNCYIFTVDLPGTRADTVEIRIRPWEVEIRGTRTPARYDAPATRIHTERVSGRFRRRFAMEEPVDPKSAECESENGVYQVRVLKLREKNDHKREKED